MPLSPKIDQHLGSPYYTGAFRNTKVMRINKLISEDLTRAGFDWWTADSTGHWSRQFKRNWLAIVQLKTTDLRLLNPIAVCIVHWEGVRLWSLGLRLMRILKIFWVVPILSIFFENEGGWFSRNLNMIWEGDLGLKKNLTFGVILWLRILLLFKDLINQDWFEFSLVLKQNAWPVLYKT